MGTARRASIALALVCGLAAAWAAPAGASFRQPFHDQAAGVTRQAFASWGDGLPPALTSGGRFGAPLGFGSALVGSAPVGNGPGAAALDAATHTLYVANGENPNGPNAGGNTVSVIDTRRCQARDVSRCQGPWPTITVGNLPSGIAVDERTDTVYVTNLSDATVSVFNGATCDALNTSGCGQTPATVPLGAGPFAILADPANHTVYVSTPGVNGDHETLSMLDSATCNATRLGACPTVPPPTVNLGATPQLLDVDQHTHTVYTTVIGAVNGFAAFDANTCNAALQTGCTAIGYLPGDPIGPIAAKVDSGNDTLYTANWDNTVSVFDLRDCNAGDLSGCATDAPGTVTPFPLAPFEHDLSVSVDQANHSVYVAYQKDDELLVIDADRCNGAHLAACATLSPSEIHTGSDPEVITLDSGTQTLYAVDEVDATVSVIDASQCDAPNVSGCRHRPLAVTLAGAGGIAVDVATHTAYVATGSNLVSMIDTRSCNAYRDAGCVGTPSAVAVGDTPDAIAIDHGTHTVYVANYGFGATGTVSVLNARTCNATHTVGCAPVGTLQVPGGNPDDVIVDPATKTLYVATIAGSGPNLISVYDVRTCNADNALGCGQTPASLKVSDSGDGFSALSVALNDATHTLYATNLVTMGNAGFSGSSVYMINGNTCDSSIRTGCGQTPVTITVAANNPIGATPVGIAVDQATNTIYTADVSVGEYPGTVSVINGATCDAASKTGCGQTPATVTTGFGTEGVAIDPETHGVYANNIEDSSVSVIDGATCNGQDQTGCGSTPRKIPVGDYPGAAQSEVNQLANSSEPVAINPAAHTAYVQDIEGVSVIPLDH
jgi:DNA-binding beta-propeller fold protein YncE